ncbi:MAG: DNA polymerase III subunit beta [Sulfuriferula sp.]|nr:DNA polymerase III subunit beta [Sulfuriferula sp.]
MLLLETNRDTLLTSLQTVMGVVEKRHTLPILSNVLIEKTNGSLSMLTTDLEIQIKIVTEIDAPTGDFSITVAAKKMVDICRAFNEKAIISLEATDNQLHIKSGKSRFNVQTLPAKDFPTIDNSVEADNKIKIEQKKLKNLIAMVQYAMAQQDIRYYLNGMLLVLENNTITVVATDGHRLCLAADELSESMNKQEIIIPRKTISELTKLLADTDEYVTLTVFKNQIQFELGNTQLISKIIDGKFPDYHRVIPVNHKNILTANRVALQQSLQRAAILSNEKFRGVRLVLSQNELKIVCSNNEQEDAQEEIEVEYLGDPLDIGFNVSYLLDALNHLNSEKILCHFGDANSSMLMTIVDNANYKYVIMPMRI